MIVEQIFAGRNNTFSLQLFRGEEAISLLAITGYELVLSNGTTFTSITNPEAFTEKTDGVVEISVGHLLDPLDDNDLGTHTAYLITFDVTNDEGVRWPKFKLKVAGE